MASPNLAFFVNFWPVEICPKKSGQNPPKPQNNRAKLPEGHKPSLQDTPRLKKTIFYGEEKFSGQLGHQVSKSRFLSLPDQKLVQS